MTEPVHYDEDEPLVVEGRTITQVDLDDLVLVGAKSTTFTGCKLRGTKFRKFLRKVSFSDSFLAECELRMIALTAVEFSSSQLEGCDFYGSALTQVSFHDSTFVGVGFDACELSDVDLTGLRDLVIGDPRTLKGATIAEAQTYSFAVRLAELSGITIEPE